MAPALTRDILKSELEEFANTALRRCLDEFRQELLVELPDNLSGWERESRSATSVLAKNSVKSIQSTVRCGSTVKDDSEADWPSRKWSKANTSMMGSPSFDSPSTKRSMRTPTPKRRNRNTIFFGLNDAATYGNDSIVLKRHADIIESYQHLRMSTFECSGRRTSAASPLDSGFDIDLDDEEELQHLVENWRNQNTREGSKQARLVKLVRSHSFESVVGVLVVMNAILIGLETDLDSKAGGGAQQLRGITGPLFCVCFSVELCLRLFAEGTAFFCSDQWKWNLFDLIMVLLQILDEVQHVLEQIFLLTHISFLRVLRVVRLIRITRLLRILHLFEDLRTIAHSMIQSFGALMWAFLILMMVIYMHSVLCMEVVLQSEDDGQLAHHADLKYYFGSLSRTMLTLFECIAGGVSWDLVVTPLIIDISPYMGVFFCSYLSLSLYAITNMLTGIFVERATAQAREDKDTYLARRLRDVFFNDDSGYKLRRDGVSWDDFEAMLDHPTLKEFFTCINVDPSEAKSIFHLLDNDGGGNLDAHELVSGCLRLRGSARALEQAMIVNQITKLQETVDFLVAIETVGRSTMLASQPY